MSDCRSRKPSTSNTGCSRRPSCSACRSPRALPAASPSSPAVPAASARPSLRACWPKVPASSWPISMRRPSDRPSPVSQTGTATTASKGRTRCHAGEFGHCCARACRPPVRRPRHSRQQCRNFLGGAGRGHDARNLEQKHVHPRHRLFPGGARGLSADEAPGARRLDGVHRLEERDRRFARRFGLLHREGGGSPSRTLHGARGCAARHPRQCRQSRCGIARLQDLAGRMAPAARRVEPASRRRSSRSTTASARCCSARSIRRILQRRSTSSPPTSRPSPRATSSMSMRAMPLPSRGDPWLLPSPPISSPTRTPSLPRPFPMNMTHSDGSSTGAGSTSSD